MVNDMEFEEIDDQIIKIRAGARKYTGCPIAAVVPEKHKDMKDKMAMNPIR